MRLGVVCFVYSRENNKFLLIGQARHIKLTRSRYPLYGEVYEGERCESAAERLVREQTGLKVEEVFSLNWGAIQKVGEEEFKEMNFLVFVEHGASIKNGEWIEIDEFIKKISWKDNKVLLKRVLERAIKREVFFDKKERGQ